jgi:hypothetical protein
VVPLPHIMGQNGKLSTIFRPVVGPGSRPSGSSQFSHSFPGLILKRASASRPSGQWRDDDYDVLEDGGGGRLR